MKWLLDTNICIYFLNGRFPALRDRILQKPFGELSVCSIVKAELCYGAMRSRNPEKTLELQQQFLAPLASFAFDDVCARQAGEIRALLANAGTPIGPYDLQIAATALANSLTLVTANTGEFSRVQGLRWEDWTQ